MVMKTSTHGACCSPSAVHLGSGAQSPPAAAHSAEVDSVLSEQEKSEGARRTDISARWEGQVIEAAEAGSHPREGSGEKEGAEGMGGW